MGGISMTSMISREAVKGRRDSGKPPSEPSYLSEWHHGARLKASHIYKNEWKNAFRVGIRPELQWQKLESGSGEKRLNVQSEVVVNSRGLFEKHIVVRNPP